ncbi:MAG TPA: tyrosine-type recombinase/integrase [Pirellulales bacterium]|jgi:site-specific recombinase XerD|nr:tyrosine-type recombinase/integrase [Pirellulales bacterium]
MPSNKGKRFPVETLVESEVESLLAACNQGVTGTRNRCLITLLYRTGLRISEALALRPSDASGNALTVLRGKGGKRRVVGIDAWTTAALSAWMATRSKAGISSRAPLFCTLDGESLETSYVRHLLPRLARKAGISKRVHPHGLRHSFASDAAMDLPLPVLSAALGHDHLSTTERYIHALNPRIVVEAMAARS